jgi:hypothetical protein
VSTGKMKAVTLVSMLLSATLSAAQKTSPDRFVYVVTIPSTQHHTSLIQTGFRLLGTKGIITALHGVADGKNFSALNEQGDKVNNLSIVSVDIPDDLALLRSKELEDRDDEGLVQSAKVIAAHVELYVLGHPVGINLYRKTVHAGDPVFKHLDREIPPDSAEAFEARKSPSDEIRILNIEDPLLPGDSGAPVLDADDHVVGIVDGGLFGGGISWAIPMSNLEWKTAFAAKARLDELARLGTSRLFAFESDFAVVADIVVSKGTDGQYQTISDAIKNAGSGARILVRTGVYREQFAIDKSCTIVGDGGPDGVVVKSPSMSPAILVGQNANVTLQKITVEGPTPSISIQGQMSVEDCFLSGASVDSHGSLSLRHCTVKPVGDPEAWYGILLHELADATLEACIISDFTKAGVVLSNASLRVRNCAIRHNKVGISLMQHAVADVKNTDLRSNASGAFVRENGSILNETGNKK